MVQWKESYSTGLTLLDEQHKNLFQYLNDLESSVREQDVSAALMMGALDYFENYIKIHFGNEETCMHRYRCPIAQTNQTAHRDFIDFFKEYSDRLKREGANYSLFKNLLSFVEDWIIKHICKIDIQLFSCVNTKPKKISA